MNCISIDNSQIAPSIVLIGGSSYYDNTGYYAGYLNNIYSSKFVSTTNDVGFLFGTLTT